MKMRQMLSVQCLQSENVADVYPCSVYNVKLWQIVIRQCLQSEIVANGYPSVSAK